MNSFNSITFSPSGSLVINNGGQTISMNQNGIFIQQCNGFTTTMNMNGIQNGFMQTHNYYPPPMNFQMQTNYYVPPNYYDQSFQESSEDYSVDSHEDNSMAYQGNYGVNMNLQVNNGLNMNVIWTNEDGSLNESNSGYLEPNEQIQQEIPTKRGLTKSELTLLPISTYKTKTLNPIRKTNSQKGKTTIKKSEKVQHDSCTICIADYKNGEKLKTLPCMHRFHSDCINEWLGRKSECPLCKYDLLNDI